MKKIENLVASLLASSLLLVGCGKPEPVHEHVDENNDHTCDTCNEKFSECVDENNDHLCDVCGAELTQHVDENGDHICDICNEGLPYVAEVTITGAPETLGALNRTTLTANVDAKNGASNTVTWVANNSNVALLDNGDGTVTVIGRIAGTTTITATSNFDEEVTASVELEVLNWTDEELEMMETYFGEALPYFEGDFVWTDAYYDQYACLTAESDNPDAIALAAEGLGASGWDVSGDDEGYSVGCLSNLTDGVAFVGQIYDYYGTFSVDVYLSEYDFAEWPADEINEMLAFEDENPEEVLPFDATAYILQESSYTGVNAELYPLGAFDLIQYFYDLADAGWSVSTAYYSSYGVLVAQSPRGSIELDIYPDYSEVDIIKLGEPTPLLTEWPADDVATALRGYTTQLPVANGESFISTIGSADAFYDLQIVVDGGNLEEYMETLEAAGFTFSWDEEYECYVAAKDEMLIDLYEYNETKFAICVYAKGLWPTAELDAATETLLGESLEIPSFEAEDYEIEDYSYYGFIGLKSTNSESLESYLAKVEDAGWTVNETADEGVYEAVSPEENCAMTIEFDSSYNGISLSIYAYAPVSTTWPADQIAAQVTSIGAEGTAVPELSADGVEGYIVLDPALGYGPVIQVNTQTSKTASILEAYIAQLEAAGYFVCGNNYGFPIYALDGETLGISPYRSGADIIYIELICLDEPAVRPSPTPAGGDLFEFPTQQITDAFGSDYAAIIPVASGTSFSFEEDGMGGYNITVYGGDHDAYISGLASTGLIHDEVPASDSHGAYDSYYTSDFSSGFDVYPADELGTYVINIWHY